MLDPAARAKPQLAARLLAVSSPASSPERWAPSGLATATTAAAAPVGDRTAVLMAAPPRTRTPGRDDVASRRGRRARRPGRGGESAARSRGRHRGLRTGSCGPAGVDRCRFSGHRPSIPMRPDARQPATASGRITHPAAPNTFPLHRPRRPTRSGIHSQDDTSVGVQPGSTGGRPIGIFCSDSTPNMPSQRACQEAEAGQRYSPVCSGGTIDPWREPPACSSWRCCLAQRAARVRRRPGQRRAGCRLRRMLLPGGQADPMPTCAGAAVDARPMVSP